MASELKNLSLYDAGDIPDGKDYKIGIVVAKWNRPITESLLNGCLDTLKEHGVKEDNIHVTWVPGSFELPYGANALDQREKLHALICLGCVIKGETPHNEYINQSVASALMQLGLMRQKPFIFGLLTPNTQEQAEDRAGGKHGNKGTEAAVTALEMISLSKKLKQSDKTIGFK